MAEHRQLVQAAGQAAFAAMAPRAGIDPASWQGRLLNARREGQGARGVLRFDPCGSGAQYAQEGAAPLIVKLRLPVEAAKFEATCAAHAHAADALPDAAPRLLATDPDHGALLLSYVAGTPAWELLSEEADAARASDILQGAGAWLGRFHAASRKAPQPADTRTPLRRLQRAAARRALPAAQDFARTLTALSAMAAPIAERSTPFAVIHGDMTLSNLLVGAQTRISGIDFENVTPQPAMLDLAGLVVDHAVWFGAGQGVDTTQAAPLIAGYGGTVDPAALRFYSGVKLMQLWAAQPPDTAERSPRRAHVRARLQEISPAFFAL